MITITPQGSVYLCKTPLENDYKNQLTFDNATSQQTYFNSKVVTSETDYTYIKKDNTMVVGKPIDDIISCNYLFYKNTGFTNKYYYCFITNMEYVNENATRITIETDVYQTYMFDIIKKACFVEREHVNDDTIGKNTTHEGIDTGEFIVNEVEYLDQLSSSANVVMGVTKLPTEMETSAVYWDKQYNGVFSGLLYVVFKTYEDAAKFLWIMDNNGLADNVINVFLVPHSLYNSITWLSQDITILSLTINIKYNFLPQSSAETTMLSGATITMNTDLNGYTPKNNKLFTKEFNYMYVTNNNGGNVEMAYEDFIDNEPIFNIIGSVTPGCSIKLIPENYKKYDTTTSSAYSNYLYDFGLVGGKYPVCSFSSDTYTNWLTQQGVNYTFGKFGDVATLGILMASGNPLGVALGGVSIIKDVLTENLKRETSPIQAKGNVNNGDVSFSASRTCFTVYQMSMKYEFAKRIDDYFSMFGYKVNEVKIPNTTGRTNWNYVKTIDCNFEGDIPQMYLNKIKEIFNNGITLWHNGSTFLDYSQSNNIVS